MNACIPSSVKAHPQIQLCPLLVLCASHSNKDLNDPVFETKLLLFLLSMFVNALNFPKKYSFLHLYKIKQNIIVHIVLK